MKDETSRKEEEEVEKEGDERRRSWRRMSSSAIVCFLKSDRGEERMMLLFVGAILAFITTAAPSSSSSHTSRSHHGFHSSLTEPADEDEAAVIASDGAGTYFSSDGGDGRSSNVTISVTMLSRRSAILSWLPPDAFLGKDFQVVFAPEGASYKVVISLSDPVGNSVHLTDLRPYTSYQLNLRTRNGEKANSRKGHNHAGEAGHVYASLNFSTAVVSSHEVIVLNPAHHGRVQIDEIFIVISVLLVWAGAVYIFFNQWGKIRGIIPYQPAFRKYDVVVDGPLDPLEDGANLLPPTCNQFDSRQFHLYHNAMAFDELMNARFPGGLGCGAAAAAAAAGHLSRGATRNHSAIFVHYASLPGEYDEAAEAEAAQRLRKSKSAESVLCMRRRPRIVVQNSVEDEDEDNEEEEEENYRRKSKQFDLREDEIENEESGNQATESSHLLHPPVSPLDYSRPRRPLSSSSLSVTSSGLLSPCVNNNSSSNNNLFAEAGDPADPQLNRGVPRSKLTLADLVWSGHSQNMVEASKNAFLQAIRSSRLRGPSATASSAPSAAPAPTAIFSNISSFDSGSNTAGSVTPSASLLPGATFGTARAVSPNPMFAYSNLQQQPASPYLIRRQQSPAVGCGSSGSGGGLRRQTSEVENTIPLTTTFFNRMHKRPNLGLPPQNAGNSQGFKVLMQQQRRNDPDNSKKKFGPTDSSDSGGKATATAATSSSAPSQAYSSYYAAAKQRVGGFRSRLTKQHPVNIWESDLSSPDASQNAAASVQEGSQQQQQQCGVNRSLENIAFVLIPSEPQHQQQQQKRWSVSSETELSRQSQTFWRYGSSNVLKSASSSRDSKEDVERLMNPPPPVTAVTNGLADGGFNKGGDIYVSVPYIMIPECEI